MKHWRTIATIFLASILFIAPLALFAEIVQYENPLGCGITSLPQFIKAVLTIIVKVGIPVATIFIIWSGFLFLTAQGDEAQLSKAKKAFVWSCIGTAVLLGAWLLATAINATVQNIGGGTNGGGGATVDGGCNTEAPPPPANLAIDPVVGWIIDGRRTPSAGTAGFYEQCAVQYPIQIGGDAMGENGLSPTDPQLFKKSEDILNNIALNKNYEQSYVFMDFGADSGNLWHTANGGETSVPVTNEKMIADFIDTSLPDTSRVTFMHSHPSAFINGQAPPSIRDLELAYVTKIDTLAHGSIPVRHVVADATGIWEYSILQGSAFAQAENIIMQKFKEFSAIPEVKANMGPEYECVMGEQFVSQATKALNGDYGPDAKTIVEAIYKAQATLAPFRLQDDRLFAANSMEEKQAIMQERLALEQSLGVSLQYTPM